MRIRDQLVLVVEDEILVAEFLFDIIREEGGIPIGPASTNSAALRYIEDNNANIAILDVNLRDGESIAVAQALHGRDIPFVIYTGGGLPKRLRPAFGNATIINKPVRSKVIIDALVAAIDMSEPLHPSPSGSPGINDFG
ncbi:response regulator [Methylobacterium nonmethylotrophicum]|uniref:Response regulator n=1 Tax=Methylobacterium nonmethylotrophicum TaxID=1141884 RepID=A0A4Z0NSQ6_9HYPH|nr:response regulator [Methylobacterium nonmethylotrophicum]TGD99406.1 response regulator [Methylobacterium nonmethylotrophicum]